MRRDDVVKMAHKAGFRWLADHGQSDTLSKLHRFANMIEEHVVREIATKGLQDEADAPKN